MFPCGWEGLWFDCSVAVQWSVWQIIEIITMQHYTGPWCNHSPIIVVFFSSSHDCPTGKQRKRFIFSTASQHHHHHILVILLFISFDWRPLSLFPFRIAIIELTRITVLQFHFFFKFGFHLTVLSFSLSFFYEKSQ